MIEKAANLALACCLIGQAQLTGNGSIASTLIGSAVSFAAVLAAPGLQLVMPDPPACERALRRVRRRTMKAFAHSGEADEASVRRAIADFDDALDHEGLFCVADLRAFMALGADVSKAMTQKALVGLARVDPEFGTPGLKQDLAQAVLSSAFARALRECVEFRDTVHLEITRLIFEDMNAVLTAATRMEAGLVRIEAALASGGRERPPPAPFDISMIPPAPNIVFGRADVMAQLDQLWVNGVRVGTLLGEGGAGKTSILQAWIQEARGRLIPDDIPVVGWSFRNGGAAGTLSDARPMFRHFLTALGEAPPLVAGPADLGRALAALLSERRILVILDGVEAMQQPEGDDEGRCFDPHLRAFLRETARTSAGLLLATSRLPLRDTDVPAIDGRRRSQTLLVAGLDDAASLGLLDTAGISGNDSLKLSIVRALEGHPLSISIFGQCLRQDWDTARPLAREAVQAFLRGIEGLERSAKVAAVLASYEASLRVHAPHALDVLGAISLVDRPETRAFLMSSIWADTHDQRIVDDGISRLAEAGLIAAMHDGEGVRLDVHPLVRSHFAKVFERDRPEAFVRSHACLFVRLTRGAPADPWRPIRHGLAAGRVEETLGYWRRELCDRRPTNRADAAGRETELEVLRRLTAAAMMLPEDMQATWTAALLEQQVIAETALGLNVCASETARKLISVERTIRPTRAAGLCVVRARLQLAIAEFTEALETLEDGVAIGHESSLEADGEAIDAIALRLVAWHSLDREDLVDRFRRDLIRTSRDPNPTGRETAESLQHLAPVAFALGDGPLLRLCVEQAAPGRTDAVLARAAGHHIRGLHALFEAEMNAAMAHADAFSRVAAESGFEGQVLLSMGFAAQVQLAAGEERAGFRSLAQVAERARSSQMVALECDVMLKLVAAGATDPVQRAKYEARFAELGAQVDLPRTRRLWAALP